MNKVDSEKRIKEIFNVLENGIANFKKVGKRRWGNPSGTQEELNTYEIKQKEDSILVATTEWANASTGEINRSAILTTVFPEKNYNSLGQTLEINLPYYFSKRFNTRVYEDESLIEIRHYGNFTIGRKGLKKIYFFEYLRENGYDNEICIDEEGEEYVCIIRLNGNSIEPDYLGERLIKWTKIIKEYKDYYRNFYSN